MGYMAAGTLLGVLDMPEPSLGLAVQGRPAFEVGMRAPTAEGLPLEEEVWRPPGFSLGLSVFQQRGLLVRWGGFREAGERASTVA